MTEFFCCAVRSYRRQTVDCIIQARLAIVIPLDRQILKHRGTEVTERVCGANSVFSVPLCFYLFRKPFCTC